MCRRKTLSGEDVTSAKTDGRSPSDIVRFVTNCYGREYRGADCPNDCEANLSWCKWIGRLEFGNGMCLDEAIAVSLRNDWNNP